MKHNTATTIIVPVYNRIAFCKSALPTMLRHQTLDNIQIIMIDDGSTDGTYKYLRTATRGDKRFLVLRNDSNIGPAASRNLALKHATGDYIGFFDIDDVIPDDYFEKLYKTAVSSNCDIVFTCYNNSTHTRTGIITDLSTKISSMTNGALWDKLFRTDLIKNNNLQFLDGRYCADTLFILQCMYYAQSVMLCNEPQYTYTTQNDSIGTDADKMAKRNNDIVIVVRELVKFARQNRFNKTQCIELFQYIQRCFLIHGLDAKHEKLLMKHIQRIIPKHKKTSYKNQTKGIAQMLCLKLAKWLHVISDKRFNILTLRVHIKKSGLFDKNWYLKQNPDVALAKANPIKHYLTYGWCEGRNPSPKFDTIKYLDNNPDVAMAGICPLVHYINYGCKEGRSIFAVKDALANSCPARRSFNEQLKYAWEYPIRVYDRYHKLKDEIRELKHK